MNKLTIGLIIILVLASGATGFMFGIQFNSQSLVLNITNKSNDTGLYEGYDDSSNTPKYRKTTRIKKNTTSNTELNDSSTGNITGNLTPN